MDIVEYLSNADERLEWNVNGMPKDDLSMENAILLKRFNRYPLIIDPSGQALEFIQKQYGGKQSNFQVTSFLDQSFRKTLESALRFGTTLLVKDVENYDPILNPVLNREVRNTAGRVLITIGDQDIDLSPAFNLILITRDSSVQFPPDICSRVTFVNFTITRGSLELQCLNQALRSERPDVDKKRSDLLKLQGEFAARLRQLEKALLTALNESKGKILDDNSVISTLEKLKTEANEVARKAAETNVVMEEVEKVSQQYAKLAHACSLIYLTLYHLHEVHFLYRYSLDFLLDIFNVVLKTPELESVKEPAKRLSIIINNLFQVSYKRVSQGMLHNDKTMFALLLLRVYLRCCTSEPAYENQFDHLLLKAELFMSDASKSAVSAATSTQIPGLDQKNILSLLALSKLEGFKNCINTCASLSNLQKFMTCDKPEADVPQIWDNDQSLTPIGRSLNELLVIHALRPDRLLASAHLFISATFGSEFMQQDKVLDLEYIVNEEVSCKTPILLCSATGYDASSRVEDLALNTGKQVTSIAIGSAEGFQQAEQALESAGKSGRWVLLKNVHLAPSWLTQLEKRLHNLKPHPQFRIMLTAEINPKLPVTIIQASQVLVFEPATGLKANLLRSISSIPGARVSRAPAERSRLYFLLCWFHALVQERLRYQPLGWANSYEFAESDLRVACDTLDAALDPVAMNRSNVAPDKLPWNALRTLLSQCIYGGKIDNKFDQLLLDSFLDKLFTPKLFEHEYVLIDDIDGKSTALHPPEETTRDGILSWVHAIKSAQLPNWIGLPNNAEKVLLTVRGQELLRNLLKMSDDELAYDDVATEDKVKTPSYLVVLSEMAQRWLNTLPKTITKFKRTKDNIKDPLFRFFEREVNAGHSLLAYIREDLEDLLAVSRAEKKQDNRIRALIAALNRGVVPQTWVRYAVPASVSSVEWMKDFGERVKQLLRFSESQNLREESVWLGGLFAPEAYVTATRQLIAQNNGWSLEQLNMHVSVGDSASGEKFTITGKSLIVHRSLKVVGAECKSGSTINLIDAVQSQLERVHFSWKLEPSSESSVTVPVYLYSNRRNLLFTFDFDPSFKKSLLYERGVAVISNDFL